MATVHFTFQPDVAVEVSDDELEWLAQWDLIYAAATYLYVQWYAYPGGPPALVTGVSLNIVDDQDETVLTTGSVSPAGDGLYLYRWLAEDQPGAGTYTANWTAIDAGGITIAASESFTI